MTGCHILKNRYLIENIKFILELIMLLTDELLEKLEPENEIYHIFPEERHLNSRQWELQFGVNAIFGVAVNPDKSIVFVLRYVE